MELIDLTTLNMRDKTLEIIDNNEVAEKKESKKSIPNSEPWTREGQQLRIDFIEKETKTIPKYLTNRETLEDNTALKGNIENYIGMSSIPTGIMGPVIINGANAKGVFYIPLATTEGTLVASYDRGARACRESGIIQSLCLKEGVQRAPIFKFKTLEETVEFTAWIGREKVHFNSIVSKTSNHAHLVKIDTNIEGNQVILNLEYTTGDASGQNMITFASQAICEYILKKCPVRCEKWFLESNYSGDKKASALSFSSVRGKKVSAEIILKKDVIKKILKTTPELMRDYWQTSFMGATKSGAIGAQGHYANGLAAIFIACGQDTACVSEAAVGITRMDLEKNGDLYCSVTLPNVIVGTIGGGTGLPTQKECLEILDCFGEGKAKKFAEICGALCLAGEISIIAALSAGHFAASHEKHGRL